MNRLFLVSPAGEVLFNAETHRAPNDFPPIAIWGRDRVFLLAHAGCLEELGDLGPTDHGALYVEADVWRITTKSVDRPRAKRVRNARVFDLAKFRAERTGGVA